MMAIVRSKRISRGGYSDGATALVAGPVWIREEDLQPVETGPSPEEIELEIQSRVEIARQEAFVEGFNKGAFEGRRSIQTETALLRGYLEQLDSEVEKLWKSIERHAVDLALEIGRKVVGEVVADHSDLAVDLARRGIALAREQTKVSLLVNPEDGEALRMASADLLKAAEGIRHIEIVERGSIARGGVIVECEIGQYDLRPEVQLQMIERKLETTAFETDTRL